MQLYVIRHTKVNTPSGLCYGHSEVPLAEDYQLDFNAFKALLPKEFDQVISSPSLRCQELAADLHADYQTNDALRELHFGDWEGLNWADISYEDSKAWLKDYVTVAPPHGESLRAMFLRINQFIDQLRNEKQESVLLVTHAGVIRCLLAYFLEFPLNNLFKLQVSYGEIYQFKLAEKRALDQVLI